MDIEARNELVLKYRYLAVRVASQFHLPGRRQDLIQQASLALISAADKFIPTKGMSFCAYASRHMWYKLSTYVASDNFIYIPTYLADAIIKSKKTGTKPTAKFAEAAELALLPPAALPKIPIETAEDTSVSDERLEVFTSALNLLTERQQSILKTVYFDKIPVREIARSRHLTHQRIYQILDEAKQSLTNRMAVLKQEARRSSRVSLPPTRTSYEKITSTKRCVKPIPISQDGITAIHVHSQLIENGNMLAAHGFNLIFTVVAGHRSERAPISNHRTFTEALSASRTYDVSQDPQIYQFADGRWRHQHTPPKPKPTLRKLPTTNPWNYRSKPVRELKLATPINVYYRSLRRFVMPIVTRRVYPLMYRFATEHHLDADTLANLVSVACKVDDPYALLESGHDAIFDEFNELIKTLRSVEILDFVILHLREAWAEELKVNPPTNGDLATPDSHFGLNALERQQKFILGEINEWKAAVKRDEKGYEITMLP